MHGDLNVIQIFTRWTSVATKSQNEYEKLDLPGFLSTQNANYRSVTEGQNYNYMNVNESVMNETSLSSACPGSTCRGTFILVHSISVWLFPFKLRRT